MLKPKKLLFDLELSPNIAVCYGRWDIRLGEKQILTPSYLMNFSYRWDGEKKTHSEAIWHYRETDRTDEMSDKEIVYKLWELMDEADIVVAHNGQRFDVKKANMFFLKHGLPPTSPFKVVDTLKVAKRHFGFDSNSLASLAIRMGCTYKEDSGGIMMMNRAVEGDKEAQAHMERYCNGDIQSMYEIEQKMHSYNAYHPNISTGHNCPKCQSVSLEKRGFTLTDSKKSKYQRYRCNDCGSWSQDRKNLLTNAEKNNILYTVK